QQAHRSDENDRQRQRPAVVLSGQRQKHEQDTKRKDEKRDVTSGYLLIGQLRLLERELARQILSTDSLHLFNRLTGTASWQCRPLNQGCGIDVIMADRIETIDALNVPQTTQWHRGNFGRRKSLKRKRVPPRQWVTMYIAYSSSRRGNRVLITKSNKQE